MHKLKKTTKILFFISLIFLGVVFLNSVYITDSSHKGYMRVRKISSEQGIHSKDFFLEEIKPILDHRCVVCHSCYSAPCQLKLTSHEGIMRGAHKINLNIVTLKEKEMTRLYTDALTIDEWRSKHFFPVVNFDEENLGVTDENGTVTKNLRDSLFYKMIDLNRGSKDLNADHFKPSNLDLHSCPKDQKEFDAYAEAMPNGGMPFGFPELSQIEFSKLEKWLELGAPGPGEEAKSNLKFPSKPEVIARWEDFLNIQNPRNKLVSRYIFEHLFLANIEFQEMPGEYFNLVRARKVNSEGDIYEIATKHPYDDPKSFFIYKFRKVQETIVHKSHLRYELSSKKMLRFKELFLQENWTTTEHDASNYSKKISSNPFLVYQDIPAKSRYQFLLDDALFFIMSFTKGPVCKSSSALNVINDQAFAFFLSPKVDLSVTDPEYLNQAAEYLNHPAEKEDGSFYMEFKFEQMKYTKLRKRFYDKKFNRGMKLSDLWDGNGNNDQAVLTIFRHEDSAHVEKGAVGGIPKTALVLDYPIFERIYYSLVAGFNPFGGIPHQLSTRLYMDNLRIEGEDLFLSFLPRKYANKLRKTWYKGTMARAKMYLLNPYSGTEAEPEIDYRTSNPKKELIFKILSEHFTPKVRGIVDQINCCGEDTDQIVVPQIISSEQEVNQALKILSSKAKNYVQYFSDFSLLKVKMKSGPDLVYSIIKNIDYANISFAIPGDSLRERQIENETLFFVKGYIGSYPNFFYVVDIDNLPNFLNDMLAFPAWDGKPTKDKNILMSLSRFVENYGIKRSNPNFWLYSDWFNRNFKYTNPKESGLLDLSRYKDLLKDFNFDK